MRSTCWSLLKLPVDPITTRLTARTLSRHPGTARTWEWCNGQSDVDHLEALEKDFCLLDVAIVEGFLGGRTRIYQWRIVIFRRAVTMDLQQNGTWIVYMD